MKMMRNNDNNNDDNGGGIGNIDGGGGSSSSIDEDNNNNNIGITPEWRRLDDVHEKTLNEVANCYEDREFGLETIVDTLCLWGDEASVEQQRDAMHNVSKLIKRPVYAREDLGLQSIRKPRRRITTLIIGNHSAGKSSFINWYIGEKIQKENIAMETSGFTFVTSGRKRATFTSDVTVRHMRFIEGIEKFDGVMDNLSTEVSTSVDRSFRNVDFIDTPGLIDGHLEYPFDINEIVVWLAQRVNLVFVFFDPQVVGSCDRTMKIIRKLNEVCREQKKQRIHYFLTMADKCQSENERNKVISQLSQSLSRAVQDTTSYYGEHALELRIIYRPPEGEKLKDDFNQINEAVELIDKSIYLTAQAHIKQLEKDTKSGLKVVDEQLKLQHRNVLRNKRYNSLRSLLIGVSHTLMFFLFGYVWRFLHTFLPQEIRKSVWIAPLLNVFDFFASMHVFEHADYRFHALAFIVVLFFAMQLGSKLTDFLLCDERPSTETERLAAWRQHLRDMLDKDGVVNNLYRTYTTEAVSQSSSGGGEDTSA